jgi:hypothetical protein
MACAGSSAVPDDLQVNVERVGDPACSDGPSKGDKAGAAGTMPEVERTSEDVSFLRGVRDIVAYIGFLAVFTVVLQSNQISSAYPYATKMRERVLGDPGDDYLAFDEVLTLDDMWDYMSGHLVDALYADDDAAYAPTGASAAAAAAEDAGYVLGVNRLIGAMRLEQSRVAVPSASCRVPPIYRTAVEVQHSVA